MTDPSPSPARTPGDYLEGAVWSVIRTEQREWDEAAQILSNAISRYSRNPSSAFLPSRVASAEARLERSTFGFRFGSGQVGLEEVGDFAANLLDTDALDDQIERYSEQRPSRSARRMVVYHGEGNRRRSVLVLDPGRPGGQAPFVLPNRAIADVILDRGLSSLPDFPGGPDEFGGGAGGLKGFPAPSFQALEALAVARPRVVVAPVPRMEPLCVPHPGWTARSGVETSTVGALAIDRQGRRGVTVCHHATGEIGTPIVLSEGGAECETRITQASAVMDTCFAPIGDNWRPAGLRAAAGLLTQRAPGGSEVHAFNGASSGPQTTRIVAVDLGVPATSSIRQLCVHTQPNVNYGDSGAALVNEDDRLVGFAFERTPYGADVPMEFASWIWAPSAFATLGLTLEMT